MSVNRIVKYCLVLVVFCSCSTEKNTTLRRGFHNLHAKYNGFFNANEIIKETYSNFNSNRKENYNKILPVFPLPTKEESKNWYPPMDTAYRKCELVIFRHRMPHEKKGRNRNKEWCRWIDDNWMTMGKTRYYKNDLPFSLKIFQYVESHYPTEKSYFESMYWQAKVLIEMEAYDQAEEILTALIAKSDEQQLDSPKKTKKLKFSEKVRLQFNYDDKIAYKEEQEKIISIKTANKAYPILADLYLRTKRKSKAIEFLERSMELKFKKEFKTRLTYILAQLYHEDGNIKASNYYQQVVERNPEYEMAFQAKINRALSFSGGQTKAIKAQLLKMLKDDKNIDYFDQIYYALAEIAFKDNEEALGIENLQTSINVSKENKEQKIKSMRRMGDLYFEKIDFISSYYYYDSISKILPPKFESKPLIDKKYKLLSKIYHFENLIEYNDSIFKICDLSEEERTKKIFEVIDLIEQEKKEQKENDLMASNNSLSSPAKNSIINQTIFFWDPTMLDRGKKEFKSNWGDRILEDNWRRSSKRSGISSEEDFENELDEPSGLYLKMLNELPCENSEKIESMKDSIMISLFNLGLTHHYETKNLELATKYFKRVLAFYQPENEAIASAYELFRIYEGLNNNIDKEEMRDLLLSKYPSSKYAKLIASNDDLTEEERGLIEEKANYKNLYNDYTQGNYSKVIDECSIKLEDSSNLLFCEYGLLMAYAQAKGFEGQDSLNLQLIKTLKSVVDHCIGSEIGEQANEILKKLKVNYAKNSIKSSNWKFNYNPDTIHFFILYVPKSAFDINKAKNNVADFNMSSFSEERLKTSNTFLNTSDQMVIVKMFKNADEAMDYFLAFKVNKGPVKDFKNQDFFVLSPNNLKQLYIEKKITNYQSFFKEFYL